MAEFKSQETERTYKTIFWEVRHLCYFMALDLSVPVPQQGELPLCSVVCLEQQTLT